MLEDSDPMVLLTQSHLAARFPELLVTLPVLDLNNDEAWKDLPTAIPVRIASDLAPTIWPMSSTPRVRREHRRGS